MSESFLLRQLAACAEERDSLRETVRQHQQALAPAEETYFEGLHLTVPEQVIIDALVSSPGRYSKERLITRLGVAPLRSLDYTANSLNVALCKLRVKLKPHSIYIRNRYNQGLSMDGASFTNLQALRRPGQQPRRP